METDPVSPSAAPKRPVRLFHSMTTLCGTALLLGIGYGVFRIKVEILLVCSAALAGGMAAWLGFGWREIQSGVLQSILRGMPAMMIVVVVGALIGSWIAAGIIPMVIYYGVGLISPQSFLLTASLAAGVMSML